MNGIFAYIDPSGTNPTDRYKYAIHPFGRVCGSVRAQFGFEPFTAPGFAMSFMAGNSSPWLPTVVGPQAFPHARSVIATPAAACCGPSNCR